MTFEQLLQLLAETVSGARARQSVDRIASFHRVQASPGYDDALEFVRRELVARHVETAVHAFRADGRTESAPGWTQPPSWRIASASLFQVEPKARRINTTEECPQMVVVHSPKGRVEADVVHVGRGTEEEDYAAVDAEGRFILAHGRASEVVQAAARHGAAGLVLYPDSERADASHDAVLYASFFPKANEIPSLVPAFSVSRRQADRLLKEMAHHSVRLRGEVDAEFVEDGQVRVLEAWVPGSDQDRGEVLLVAHLCHPRPSANDNASGSAVLLELARVFQEIRCRLPLHQTIRFLWVPEFYGTLPWAMANRHALQDIHFVINLDMVGQSPERIGTPVDLFRAPDGTPSYLNACLEPIGNGVARVAPTVPGHSSRPLHWRLNAPSGGSDHLVFSAPPHELPAMMIGGDDPFWHTSMDTVENVDATRLQHVALLAGALCAVPSMIDEASLLPDWLLDYGVRRLTSARRLARSLEPPLARRLIALALEIEEERAESLADLAWCDGRTGDVRGLLSALNGVYEWMVEGLPQEGASGVSTTDGVRPRRAIEGPLPYAVTSTFDREEKDDFKRILGLHHRGIANSLFCLCDGTRSLEDLALHLMLDYDRVTSIEEVRRGVALLAKAGAVSL